MQLKKKATHLLALRESLQLAGSCAGFFLRAPACPNYLRQSLPIKGEIES
jgi:hypothetical protein